MALSHTPSLGQFVSLQKRPSALLSARATASASEVLVCAPTAGRVAIVPSDSRARFLTAPVTAFASTAVAIVPSVSAGPLVHRTSCRSSPLLVPTTARGTASASPTCEVLRTVAAPLAGAASIAPVQALPVENLLSGGATAQHIADPRGCSIWPAAVNVWRLIFPLVFVSYSCGSRMCCPDIALSG